MEDVGLYSVRSGGVDGEATSDGSSKFIWILYESQKFTVLCLCSCVSGLFSSTCNPVSVPLARSQST
jgi:hypothetical protein